MCYLIAKEFDKQGCIAVKTRHGKELSNMVNEMLDDIDVFKDRVKNLRNMTQRV